MNISASIASVMVATGLLVPMGAIQSDATDYVGNKEETASRQFVGDSNSQLNGMRQLFSTRAYSVNGGYITAHQAHLSPGRNEMSGHVSWKAVGTPRFKTMRLTAQLYARQKWGIRYYAVGQSDTRDAVSTSSQTPGANARFECVTNKETHWYTYGTGYAPGVQKAEGSHSSKSSD